LLKWLRLHAERLGWSAAELTRATATDDGTPARIDFVAEPAACPRCGDEMRVAKSRTRTVVTLVQGTFVAREICKQCASHAPCCPVVGSQTLAQVVKPRQRHGYDLVVHVGLARYLRGMQREEIRAELNAQRDIQLSTGTVSHLCDRFLSWLEALHVLRAPQLRAAMEGGYPLHLDATSDSGKGGLVICLDGWRGWVLTAARIPTEHERYLQPLVKRTVALFGDPIATLRDLSDACAAAVKPLHNRGIADLVCHYHFLAAVGNKLFDQPHALLREIIRYSHVRSDLRALLRTLRRYRDASTTEVRFGPGRVREELLALVLWTLEGTGTKNAHFPFSLPHLDFVRRCSQALQRANAWLPCPRTQPERRALRHLGSVVARLQRDCRVASASQTLDHGWQAFCALRDVLRLSNAELPRGDTRTRQQPRPALELLRLHEIEQAVQDYRAQLQQRLPKQHSCSRKPASPQALILKYLDRYGARLFGHPAYRDEDGEIVAVVPRTNNPAEHFFGRTKQSLRRRLGRANLGRDLQQQPAQAALAANLRHPEYVRVLCGSLENLPAAFAALHTRSMPTSSALHRDHRDKQLHRRVRQLLEAHAKAAA